MKNTSLITSTFLALHLKIKLPHNFKLNCDYYKQKIWINLILIITYSYYVFFPIFHSHQVLKLTIFRQGWHFITYTAEPVLLLPWLMKKFAALGGKVERRNIKTLHQLAEEGYDLIINCSGLGARELVADKTMMPIRGQVYRVIDTSIYIAYIPLFKQIQVIIY